MFRLTGSCVYISKAVALLALFALPVGAGNTVLAAKTIYRCTKDGQVTLTDKPCDGASSDNSASSGAPQSSATTIPSSSNPSPVGGWHGQMQYQGQQGGQMLEEAH